MKCVAAFCALFFLSLISSATFAQTSLSKGADPNMGKSIIERASASENLKTLLAAVRAADLAEILDNDGPFTVFAPSDMAFKKFSKEKIAYLLLPENKKELFSLLSYHIVAGNFTASRILRALIQGNGKTTFTSVQGTEITASISGIDIVLTDHFGNSAKITAADLSQCNGVIHEIDSVILPNKI